MVIGASFLVSLLVMIVVFALIYYYLIPLLPYPFNVIAQVVMVVILILWLVQTFLPSAGLRVGLNSDGGTAGTIASKEEDGISLKASNDPFPGLRLALNGNYVYIKDGGTVHNTGNEVILAASPKCRSWQTI